MNIAFVQSFSTGIVFFCTKEYGNNHFYAFQVSQYGLEALILIAEALQGKYKIHCGQVMSQCINRLGKLFF